MKKIVYLFAVLALVACERDSDAVSNVQFNVIGLDVQQQDLVPARTATTDPADAGLTELWVIEGSKTLAHQLSTDADFGTPIIQLTTGQHSLTFIGSGKNGQQVVNGVWSADRISDTYGCVHQVNVQDGMDVQNVVLSHANYVISWSSTDVVPNSAVTAEVEVVGHRNKLKSGLAGCDADSGYVFSANITGKIGYTLTMSVSGFCKQLGVEDTVTTIYRVKDINDNVLYAHSKVVPVLSNRKTIVSGALFGSSKSSVCVQQDWLDDYEVAL